MQKDPFTEWQRLAAHYGEMSDLELYELDADLGNLTETAQQVLGDEMRKRALKRQPLAGEAAQIPFTPLAQAQDEDESSFDGDADEQDGDLPREYTWKTILCECDSSDEAWQLREALRQAGIESWLEGPRYQTSFDLRNPKVLVAADQLDRAREVAARPIPQEIVELSQMEEPSYEAPICPACGTPDPVLESAEPVNAWLCELCGKQWTEPPLEPSPAE
jgi:hypothetical protein